MELRVVQRDFARQKPERESGWMQDSEPPASMMVASEWRMNREASPRACAPVVQAVEAAWLGPWSNMRMLVGLCIASEEGLLLGTRASW